ncbi:MAG: hypothetical protein ABI977_36435 [Acidobacteriota bacterium]
MQQEQTNNTDQTINDLAVAETEQAEIKGGPKRIFIGGLSAKETQTELADLEPSGEIKGGPGHGGVWLNHNETVAVDENEEAATTAPLADLTVSNEQAEQAKGGPTKRVWDYIRGSY